MTTDLTTQSQSPPEAMQVGDERAGGASWSTALFVLFVNLAVTGAAVWAVREPTRGAVRLELPPTRTLPATPTAAAPPTPGPLVVHVSGHVARPGVVEVPAGARVADAVAAAGGLTGDADADALNLAATLADGDHLVVPSAGQPAGAGITHAAPAGPPAAVGSSETTLGSPPGGALHLNAASAAELESLPGIGPALAERIVAYREANGPFGSPRELLKVKGIGERTLAEFESRLQVP